MRVTLLLSLKTSQQSHIAFRAFIYIPAAPVSMMETLVECSTSRGRHSSTGSSDQASPLAWSLTGFRGLDMFSEPVTRSVEVSSTR